MKAITFFEKDREPTPDNPNKIITGVVDDNAEIYINRLEQENKQLKEDKKKAIKYLKEYQETQAKYCYVDFDKEDIDKLLEKLGDKDVSSNDKN